MSRADMDKNPDEVAGMFDAAAKGYDRSNVILSGGTSVLWRIATVRALAPRSGERVLDIAAGTGTSSAAIAKAGATVVALDISPGMIELGRERHPRIEFVEGDAERLPFGDDTFDAVTISFGLRNVQNPQLALAEMYRVLKPGGRLLICEFSRPPHTMLRAGYHTYLRTVLPALAKLASTNPEAYHYLNESIKDWPDQGTLAQWIRGVGFTRVAYRNLNGGIVALHRGRKPEDEAIRANNARRTAARKEPTEGEAE